MNNNMVKCKAGLTLREAERENLLAAHCVMLEWC